MQILISSVKIPDRVRKDMGDLDSLMDSLRRCGQLNPITVTRDMVLIAGHRRFESASRLGWRSIDATVIDGIDDVRRLEIELEENIHRKDFSPEELLAGVRRLDELRHPKPMKRIASAVRKAFSALAFWRYFGKRKGTAAAAGGALPDNADDGADISNPRETPKPVRTVAAAPAEVKRVAVTRGPDDEALGI